MFFDFQYAYLALSLFFLLAWIGLFLYRRDLRKEMLIMSLVVAPMGPLANIFYLRDYWQPEFINYSVFVLQDLLIGFVFGGIAAVVYEVFFSKRFMKRHLASHGKWMLTVALFFIAWLVIGTVILHFNSIYVSISGFLIVGASFLFYRHDLLRDALLSGLFVGGLMFIFYLGFIQLFDGIIQEWWKLENISGVLIFGVPLEELMWGFGWGFVAGPAYEFFNGLRIRKP